jgi:hypothetical protein
MLPAWATVAISLGAAFITGAAALLGSLVRGRQERALQLHDRSIEAAGDFSKGALKAIAAIRDVVRPPATNHPATEDKNQLEVLGLLHQAETQVGLVSLLFGTSSDAARQANKVKVLLQEAELLVGHAPIEELRANAKGIQAKADTAERALDDFMEAARKVLESASHNRWGRLRMRWSGGSQRDQKREPRRWRLPRNQ